MATTNNQDQRIPQLLRLASADIADEDLIPIVDMSAAANGVTKATTVDSLTDAVSLLLPPQSVTVTGGNIQSITDVSFGGNGDGSTDNAAAIAAISAAGAVDTFMAQGSYAVASNKTVNFPIWPAKGAKWKPASGKTLTFATRLDHLPPSHVFDDSDGGAFAFTVQRWFRPEWFGVVGDGSTDDLAALQFMFASIPDYAVIVGSAALQMLTSDELVIASRKGVKWVNEPGSLPDGNGAQLIWGGPSRLIDGDDASMTYDALSVANSKILTTTTGKFTADMVGQRIIVDGAGSGADGLMAKIASYTSATEVVLDTACSRSASGKPYLVGPATLYLESCDHVDLSGLTVRPASADVIKGYDAYIASGDTVLHIKAHGQFTLAMQGRQIRVTGAGPSGTDLYTTIATYTSATQVTLANAASTAITSSALAEYIVGSSATSFPARYGVLMDRTSLSGSTGTMSVLEALDVHSPIEYECYLIAVSLASDSNQEYHIFRRNVAQGNANIEMYDAAVTTVATSPDIVTSRNVFTTAHTGRRVIIPNAGGVDTALEGKIIDVTDATHATMDVNAVAAVSDDRIFLGNASSYGLVIGDSPNAKGIVLEGRNNLHSHKYGFWMKNGSTHSTVTTWTGCETDIRIDGSSEPSTFIGNNTEQALRHLDWQGGTDTVTLIAPRLGNLQMQPNGGYIRQGQVTGTLVMISPTTDNAVADGSTIHTLTSANNHLQLVAAKYAGSPTMTEIGISQAQVDAAFAWVSVQGHRTIADAPADIFTVSGAASGVTISDGKRGSWSFGGQARLSGGMAHAVRTVSSNTVMVVNDTVLLVDASGGAKAITLPDTTTTMRVEIKKIDSSGNAVTVTPASGTIDGAANVSTTTQWAVFTLVSDGTGDWYQLNP